MNIDLENEAQVDAIVARVRARLADERDASEELMAAADRLVESEGVNSAVAALRALALEIESGEDEAA